MPLPSFLERFRRGSAATPDAVPLSSSDVEALRVRARRRLIGMVVLVGAGVIGFPWLFETKPRPMAGDIQIVQAPQPGVSVGASGNGPAGGATATAGAAAVAGATIAAVTAPRDAAAPARAETARAAAEVPTLPKATGSAGEEREEFISDVPARPAASRPVLAKPVPPKAVASAPKPAASRPADKAEKAEKADKAVAKGPDKSSDKSPDKASDKAKDKLAEKKPEKSDKADKADKAADKDKSSTRYVVQFGAFAEASAAHEARLKAERLGLKTYAQQVDTPQGKRIRVRLGPFADKAEADKAAASLRKAGLPGAVLTL